MKLINDYVVYLQNTLEKLSKIMYSKKGKKYSALSNKIDRDLLEKYKIIEDMIDKELEKN